MGLTAGRARSRAKKSPDSQTGPTTSTRVRRLRCRLSGWLLDGDDLVVGVVERGADEVVHGGVGDDEGFGAVLLDVEDAGEEGSGLGDDEAAGFEEEMGGFVGEAFGEGGGVLFYLLGGVEGARSP